MQAPPSASQQPGVTPAVKRYELPPNDIRDVIKKYTRPQLNFKSVSQVYMGPVRAPGDARPRYVGEIPVYSQELIGTRQRLMNDIRDEFREQLIPPEVAPGTTPAGTVPQVPGTVVPTVPATFLPVVPETTAEEQRLAEEAAAKERQRLEQEKQRRYEEWAATAPAGAVPPEEFRTGTTAEAWKPKTWQAQRILQWSLAPKDFRHVLLELDDGSIFYTAAFVLEAFPALKDLLGDVNQSNVVDTPLGPITILPVHSPKVYGLNPDQLATSPDVIDLPTFWKLLQFADYHMGQSYQYTPTEYGILDIPLEPFDVSLITEDTGATDPKTGQPEKRVIGSGPEAKNRLPLNRLLRAANYLGNMDFIDMASRGTRDIFYKMSAEEIANFFGVPLTELIDPPAGTQQFQPSTQLPVTVGV